jgi:hypothetical protein
MTLQQVSAWLEENDLGQYCARLHEHSMDGEAVAELVAMHHAHGTGLAFCMADADTGGGGLGMASAGHALRFLARARKLMQEPAS